MIDILIIVGYLFMAVLSAFIASLIRPFKYDFDFIFYGIFSLLWPIYGPIFLFLLLIKFICKKGYESE